jgi:hypothetical protein
MLDTYRHTLVPIICQQMSGNNMPKTPITAPPAPVRTTMRLDPALKTALDKAAKDDARTATSLVTKILSDWLKERGYLK